MAASEPDMRSDQLSAGAGEPLSAAALSERLSEEIDRAARQGTQLSCLLVLIADLEESSGEHGDELPAETLAYIARALQAELRRFDRVGRPSDHELLIVLPGADGPRGEMVARRVLDRVRAIKIESHGTRRSLRVAVGLTAWRKDDSAEDILARTRAAGRAGSAENGADGIGRLTPAARWQSGPAEAGGTGH